MNFMLDDKTKAWLQERGGVATIDPPLATGG